MSSDQLDDDNIITPPKRPSRLMALQRSNWTRGIIIGGAVVFVLYSTVAAKIDTINAQQQTREFAEPLDELCATNPEARRTVGTARCDQAAAVKDAPVPIAENGKNGVDGKNGSDGETGKDGKEGRGIISTTVANGRLLVAYTDGKVEDKGIVVGAKGVDGQVGEDGRGIVNTGIDEDGRLHISYSDGDTEIVGTVVGRNGDDGRGVLRTEARDGRLLVYYTDDPDVPVDAGPLPVGPSGPVGRGIVTADLNLTMCTLTIYYTDDTSEVKTVTGCEPDPVEPPPTTDDPPPEETTEPSGLLPIGN